ncbi:DUF930 domain-containing protein [Ciceribacter sp. L1K23]|uniref:DUF930 domain-containing protein n=1 Tax=unclassified Ciceribacter TaxID=2628820 RepID=UPI001ABDF2B9|nr:MULTISPECIES: DUF930 domain-containing protein [unclassified Ciceribacter]MBO3759333.1 DUF930 domain-containing protein [Ciceribacter sp. L1K22]MBR0556458.1 DUF930 domain-containing protein [Ciceribacter sp. L1K23]
MKIPNVAIAALVAPVVLAVSPALALEAGIVRQLEALTPEERLEQRCDMEAMDRIRKEQDGFRPDKVIAYTFSDPEVADNRIKAPGAVFRSGGDWYRLKFKCETGPRQLTVKSFKYQIGSIVPREEWQEYYLYN